DRDLADGTVGLTEASVEDAQVVVHLRDGSDGRARTLARRLLLDADGRRQAADVLDLRLLHLAEELTSVRRQRLDVAPLTLGVDRVECERRLAGTARSAADRHLAARHFDGDVFQVVLGGALDTKVGDFFDVLLPLATWHLAPSPARRASAVQDRREG